MLRRIIWSCLFIVLAASGCNLPRSGAPPTLSGVALINTAAAETIAAQLTRVSQPPVGGTIIPPATSLTPQPPASVPTTAPGSPTQDLTPASACDQATFVRDVNVADNSEIAAGSVFTKTWRLENSGTCTWGAGYTVVFAGGEAMGSQASQPLGKSVPPGETVDISVVFKAPEDPGTYRSDWRLRNAANAVFGIGEKAQVFYVQIQVPGASGTLLDFISSADEAAWTSGIQGGESAALTFGGADDDPVGSAKIKDGVLLENGITSGKILLTFPRRVENGMLMGVYPAYTVRRGDHILGRLGFLTNTGGACGSGLVKFQIGYMDGSSLKVLGESSETCDGKMSPVDIDLASLRGQTVRFALVVLAEGGFTDDWAVWNSLRIER